MAKGPVKTNIDFTQGSIIRKLILFAVPIVLGELLQNLYHTADSIVVGNFVGSKALAAVSVCSVISNMVVGFFNGMSIGASVLVARFFGGGNEERLHAGIKNTFAFSVLLGTFLSLVGIAAAPWLISVVDVPADVVHDALTYLRIYLAGVIFTVIYNVAAGLLRAVGDSRGPFRILVCVCSLNVVLDLLFVAVFGWGVAGVASATVISQLTAVIIVYFRIQRYDHSFRLSFADLVKERGIISEMVSIGFPAGMQNSLVLFSNLFVWKYIGGFGSAALAAVGGGNKIDRFVAMPCKAFGLSMTTFVGQNVGARKGERVRLGYKSGFFLIAAYCLVVSIPLYIFADKAMLLFTRDHDVVTMGARFMRTLLPFYLVVAVREVTLGTLRGYGDTKIPMLLSLFGMVVVRQVFLMVALPFWNDIRCVFVAFPLAWCATSLMNFCYYLMKRKKYEALTSGGAE